MIYRFDRLAPSTRDLLGICDTWAGLRSLGEPRVDTPGVRMVLTVFAGIAGFEREAPG